MPAVCRTLFMFSRLAFTAGCLTLVCRVEMADSIRDNKSCQSRQSLIDCHYAPNSVMTRPSFYPKRSLCDPLG